MRSLPLLALIATAACSMDQPLTLVGERATSITGGQGYSGHPAVGRLKAGQAACTASLIGNKTVLTAAHCIIGSSLQFVLDNGETIPAVAAHKHPNYAGQGSTYDIAIVVLSKAPSVTPLAVAAATN